MAFKLVFIDAASCRVNDLYLQSKSIKSQFPNYYLHLIFSFFKHLSIVVVSDNKIGITNEINFFICMKQPRLYSQEASLLKKVDKHCTVSDVCFGLIQPVTNFYIWFAKQQYQEDQTEVTPPSYTLYNNNLLVVIISISTTSFLRKETETNLFAFFISGSSISKQ